MSTAFASGFELSLVFGTALVLSLAGTWLARRFTPNHTAPAATPSIKPTRHRVDHALTISRRHWSLGKGLASYLAVIRQHIAAAREALNAAVRTYVSKSRRGTFLLAAPANSEIQIASAATTQMRRLSLEEQWARTERVVAGAVRGAQTIRKAQAVATDKLDAAHYAFEKLMSELDAVMTLKPTPAEIALFPGASNVVSLRKSSADARVAA